MEYTQDLILDLNSNAAYTTIGAKQSDNNSRIVKIHVVENGEDYNLAANGVDAAYFRFRKPDGKAIINPAQINNDNTITIVFTSQTLAAPGRGYGDITLMHGSTILSTVSFIVVIMASPQVAQEAVSSNEFGYLQAVVDDATHTIYEAQAWATGQRGTTEVYSEDSFVLTINSTRIVGVPDPNESIVAHTFDDTINYLAGEYVWYDDNEHDQILYQFIQDHLAGPWLGTDVIANQTVTQFFRQIGNSPGLKRVFTFQFQANGTWLLYRKQIEGITETSYDAELVTNIDGANGYFPGLVYIAGYDEPAPNDNIVVTICEADSAYQNNAKYYAHLANERKEAIESLTVSAEKVYADEFVEYKNYEIGDYVWYGTDQQLLYQFTAYHSAGPWNPIQVIEEAIVEKDVLSSPAHFHFKVPQGPVGNVNFVTFDIDTTTGNLMLNTPDYTNPRVDFFIGCERYPSTRPNDNNLYVDILYGA